MFFDFFVFPVTYLLFFFFLLILSLFFSPRNWIFFSRYTFNFFFNIIIITCTSSRYPSCRLLWYTYCYNYILLPSERWKGKIILFLLFSRVCVYVCIIVLLYKKITLWRVLWLEKQHFEEFQKGSKYYYIVYFKLSKIKKSDFSGFHFIRIKTKFS